MRVRLPDGRLQLAVLDHQPRLFECSNKTGRFIVTEVTHFTQDDLSEDDVMLLDTWDQVVWTSSSAKKQFTQTDVIWQVTDLIVSEPGIIWKLHSSFQVFLWIGKEANEVEHREAVVTSREYLHTHPGDRDPDTPIILIKQRFEPPTFTGWFTAWDSTKWSVSPSTLKTTHQQHWKMCWQKWVWCS